MLNTNFDPYNAIIELQQLQHLQADNLVKVSEWMMEVSQNSIKQQQQVDRQFNLIQLQNKQVELLSQRILLLEQHLLASINNDELKDTTVSLN